MFLIAKPLVQEYTTLNIVHKPSIAPKAHVKSPQNNYFKTISEYIHKDLDKIVKRSENLLIQKKQETVIPHSGVLPQLKYINEKYVDAIRKFDTSVSPLPRQLDPNTPIIQESQKDIKKVSKVEERKAEQQNYFRQKYDKEYDFKVLNKKNEQKRDFLDQVQLPQSILEIKELMNQKNEYPEFQFQDEEFLDDLIEDNQFKVSFKEQAIETNKQLNRVYLNKSSNNILYDQNELDFNNLDFQSIINIANGSITNEQLVEQISNQKQKSERRPIKEIQITSDDNNSKAPSQPKIQNFEELINQNFEKEYSTKYVQTTPKKQEFEKIFDSKDESVQISVMKIEEETRNLAQVSAILENIKKLKEDYRRSKESSFKSKIKSKLNNHLIDLMNLIMKDEGNAGDTLGDAVAYLLQKRKQSLIDKTIDGHSKLELFYIFLTEYKFLKEIQEKDAKEQKNVMSQYNYVTTKKMTEGWKIKGNSNSKKDYNSLSFHFKSSSSTTPQYMKPTIAYIHSAKPSKSPNKSNAKENWIGNIENDDLLYSWRRIQQ